MLWTRVSLMRILHSLFLFCARDSDFLYTFVHCTWNIKSHHDNHTWLLFWWLQLCLFAGCVGYQCVNGRDLFWVCPSLLMLLLPVWIISCNCIVSGTMTRIGAVKQLFHAFANRSMAYNYPHVIGLTLFGSSVKVVSKVSELFESFKVNMFHSTDWWCHHCWHLLL